MKYLFTAIIYCETSLVSTDPKLVYNHFKNIEEGKGEAYISSNDDYWISVIEMDKIGAKELTFENSSSFFDFMGKFEISEEEMNRRFNNKNT